MSQVWNKLDSGLSSIYSNYLHVQKHGTEDVAHVDPVVAEGGRLNVSLIYKGDLAEIEAQGFQTVWNEGTGRATGTVDLANLERLAAHPGVLKMSFGEEREPMLDESIDDIGADQVWSFASGSFSGTTGKNVIVGVIDTGIDIHHPFFRETTPPRSTRILRIWDPGLEPEVGDRQPDPARLDAGGPTYGVEYRSAEIMAALGGLGNFRHRDCNGHGTHVASIAAGNGQDKFKFIGVAPEADLIIVKFLYLQKYPKTGVPRTRVNHDKLFRDAVSYILNVAKDDFAGRPVVINYSVGSGIGPHDGFTDDEDFLTHKFSGAVRQVFVSSAGNSGGRMRFPPPRGVVDKRQHARIEFPAAGGTVDIPVELYYTRTNRMAFNFCQWKDVTNYLKIQFYYPPGGPTFSAELDIPKDGTGFIAGPALPASIGPIPFGGGKRYTMTHKHDNQPLRAGGTVNRNLFEIKIEPRDFKHRVGKYMVRIASTGALTVQMWCQQSRGHGFRVDTSPPVPANVFVEDRFLIGSDAGADNIVTVAAYNAEAPGLDITSFSSTGPLASYGGGPPQPDKPDLAAPGNKVDAAKSRDAKPKMKKTEVVPKSGTSMAAPHVAGAVALMLEKNPALTLVQIVDTLTTHIRTTPPVPAIPPITPADKVGHGRLDAKDAFDHTP